MVHNSFLTTYAIQYGSQQFGTKYIMVHNSFRHIQNGSQQFCAKYIMVHNSFQSSACLKDGSPRPLHFQKQNWAWFLCLSIIINNITIIVIGDHLISIFIITLYCVFEDLSIFVNLKSTLLLSSSSRSSPMRTITNAALQVFPATQSGCNSSRDIWVNRRLTECTFKNSLIHTPT